MLEIRYIVNGGIAAGFLYLVYDYYTKNYSDKKKTVLGNDPTKPVPLPLIKKTVLNHNTRIFRYFLEHC